MEGVFVHFHPVFKTSHLYSFHCIFQEVVNDRCYPSHYIDVFM